MQTNHLKKLVDIFSPPGDERGISRYVANLLGKTCNISEDSAGNLLVKKGAHPSLAIMTHMDSVGFMLQEKINDGVWSAVGLGRVQVKDKSFVRMKDKDVFSRGVVTQQSEEENTFFIETDDKELAVGDKAVFTPALDCKKNTIQGTSLDDKVGIWLVSEVMRKVKSLVWILTVQEEVKNKGSLTAARSLERMPVIVLDMTYASSPEKKEVITMLSGPSLTLKDDFLADKRMVEIISQIAQRNQIPMQYEVLSSGGSDLSGVYLSGMNLPYAFLGIPLQFMHTDHELVSTYDIKQMEKLLVLLAQEYWSSV